MSDPTRFDLTERQRAMLAEMGVRVWWPQTPVPATPAQALRTEVTAAPAAAPPIAQLAAASARPAPVLRPMAPAASAASAVESAPAPALPEGVDQMDWASLQETVSQCRACGLCSGRKNPVCGEGQRRAPWMVIADAPTEGDDPQEALFAGPAGKLLDNMLQALGLSRHSTGDNSVYITSPLQCRPASDRNPQPQELATCAPYWSRQIALVQPRVILLMGRFAVQSVLQTSLPLGKLRGHLHSHQGVPVVATYHPQYLLRNQADKAKAWADLLLALKSVQG